METNNSKTVWELFDSVVQKAKKIENLNYGGCGIFAEELHKWLVKHKVKHKLVMFSGMDPDDVQYRIKNGERCWKSHVLIKLPNGLYVDSKGIEARHRKMCSSDNEVPIGPRVLKRWNNDPTEWNPNFDRSQIPTIKQIFQEI